MSNNYKNRKMNKASKSNLPLSIFLGVVSGISTTLILSLVLSAISLKFKNPVNLSGIFSIISVALGGIICGISSSANYKESPLLPSLVSNSILGVIILLANLNSTNFNLLNTLFFPLMIISLGCISSLILKGNTKHSKIKRYLK